jgi:general secretion pathway protein G
MFEINYIGLKVDSYQMEFGRYPESIADVLVEEGDIYKTDPWGNRFYYQITNSSYVLLSYGADGESGGEGENADILYKY